MRGLQPYLANPEGFDPHDLQPQKVTASLTGMGAQDYPVAPLIRTSALTRSDWWHTEFVNPRVYDELQWLYSLTRRSDIGYNQLWWSRMIRQGASMFDALRTNHSYLSDIDIAAATGDPMYRVLAYIMGTIRIQIDDSGRPTISLGSSGSRSTVLLYDQPTYVSLDWGRARDAAAYELQWCNMGGDVGYDATTCRRLRRIAAQRFDNPYSGDYTTWWYYLHCQNPDSPRSYQFRFRYDRVEPRIYIPIR